MSGTTPFAFPNRTPRFAVATAVGAPAGVPFAFPARERRSFADAATEAVAHPVGRVAAVLLAAGVLTPAMHAGLSAADSRSAGAVAEPLPIDIVPQNVVGATTWAALEARKRQPMLTARPKVSRRRRVVAGPPATIAKAIAAGDAIARLPYRYGGGHGSFQDSAYDCSGSISYVLHAIGRLDAPMASTGFMSYGEPGPGRWITIYTNPGHAFMVINGRRFDTSGARQTGSRWQAGMRSESGYVVRHPAGL